MGGQGPVGKCWCVGDQKGRGKTRQTPTPHLPFTEESLIGARNGWPRHHSSHPTQTHPPPPHPSGNMAAPTKALVKAAQVRVG